MSQQKNEKEKYYCTVRKKHLNAQPEALVREDFIQKLITDYHVPLAMLEVEKHLWKYGVFGENQDKRPDIIINYYRQDRTTTPIVIIECKKETIPLTFDVKEQAENYCNALRQTGKEVDIYGITNGIKTQWFVYCSDSAEFRQFTDLPSYEQLLAIEGLEYVEYTPYYSTDDDLKNDGVDAIMIPVVKNLQQLFLDESNKVTLFKENSFELTKDAGLRAEKNSNASGFDWLDENYRNFKLNVKGLGTNPNFSVRVFSRYFTVSFGNDKKHFGSLKMDLFTSVAISGNTVEMWHRGSLSGSAEQDVIDFVKGMYPELVVRNRIYLGELDNSKKFTFENADVLHFFKNLIKYTIARQKFRAARDLAKKGK
jgi:Type I restriction enzyme R protein N terminus (HSDR_N)